jgi:tight adherence protein C
MIFINSIILILFIIVYILAMKQNDDWIRSIDQKEHKLYFLYPMADWILIKTNLVNVLNTKSKVGDTIKALYVTSKSEMIQKLYWYKRISLIIAIIFIFNLFSVLSQFQSMGNSIIQEGRYLKRPNYGSGYDEVDLMVTMKSSDKKDDNNQDEIKSEKIRIKVEEQVYPKAELVKAIQKAINYLTITVLGNNTSADLIYNKLNFTKVIPGTSITVEWEPENYNLIQLDGTVKNDALKPEGVTTKVTAILKYRKEKFYHEMTFRIMPKIYPQKDQLLQQLKEEIALSSERTKEQDRLELPNSLGAYQLSWNANVKESGATLLFLGVMAAVLTWLYGDQELKKRMKERKTQMMLDYPEIINKFTLLINAGMTVKQAWSKIVEDYSRSMKHRKKQKRYAYEEMLITVHEINLGISEQKAYEQYGRRAGLMPYMKFSSLIAQNLKKGNKGLSELLTKEAIEAFEERKELAKRLGEEAGTKLLAPMMVMLLIVFLIILIPAFQAFKV